MPDVLNVTVRETRGTSQARRDRAAGKIPAVLYGHGKENITLTVVKDELESVIRRGNPLVDLAGGVSDSALIKDLQWDAFGIDVLHVDFTRVKAGEVVELTLTIELRGEAPGTKAGGVVIHAVHELPIECPVTSITDKVVVTINSLELDESITAADVELPEGAKLLVPPETIVVQCVEPTPEEEEEEEGGIAGASAEPDVIGRADEEGEEAGD